MHKPGTAQAVNRKEYMVSFYNARRLPCAQCMSCCEVVKCAEHCSQVTGLILCRLVKYMNIYPVL